MNPTVTFPAGILLAEADPVVQIRSGHGATSQDLSLAAQSTLEPLEMRHEDLAMRVGGGAVAGAATGAAIGVVVAGPAGVVVGAGLGAAVGALSGAAAGATIAPPLAASAAEAVQHSVRLHIEDSGGSGRPVVLIHGWPLTAQAWEPQVSVLRAAGFRVVAYDRRGFGRSDRPASGYGYDALADDLMRVLDQCGLRNVTLVGFSMGGGEVARYVARHGEARLHSVVFAAAVPPYLMKSADNPDGPLTSEKAREARHALEQDRESFFDQFTKSFYSANGALTVTEKQLRDAVALCNQSAQHAALACMDSFGTTDFREDLKKVTVPTLVIHGDADAVVPFEGSGQRTHRAVPHSKLVRLSGAPHGVNVSHAQAFNNALLSFLQE